MFVTEVTKNVTEVAKNVCGTKNVTEVAVLYRKIPSFFHNSDMKSLNKRRSKLIY